MGIVGYSVGSNSEDTWAREEEQEEVDRVAGL